MKNVTKLGRKKGKTPYFSCYQGKLSTRYPDNSEEAHKARKKEKAKMGMRSNMDIRAWKPKMKNGFYETRCGVFSLIAY